VVDPREVRARLDAALREREAARRAADAAEAEFVEAMRQALAAGVTVTEVAELTGYHRNSVRRIVDSAENAEG
jgi:DNA-binding phage protein